jgi:hypothetical protein
MSTEQHTETAPELLIHWSILLLPQGAHWLAIGLEHTILWFAETQEAAFEGLIETLYWQAEADRGCGQKPFSLAEPSRERYWNLFANAIPAPHFQVPSPLRGEVRVLV